MSTIALKDYYESYDLDLDTLVAAKAPHRFIRLNPRFDGAETLGLVEKEIRERLAAADASAATSGPPDEQPFVRSVPWLDDRLHFYAVPSAFHLSQSECFRLGRLYGQDASSGAAVAALLTSHFDDDDGGGSATKSNPAKGRAAERGLPIRVLDLCCCPGLKLCAMADFLRQESLAAQVVGVDVSQTRMATCRQVVQKYQINDLDDDPTIHIQLYCHDGTKLGTTDNDESAGTDPPRLVFDSRVALEQLKHLGKRKRQNKSSRARERKMLYNAVREELCPTFEANSFDYVLVDAECSTDGSIRHVRQRIGKTDQQVLDNPLVTDPQQLADLVELQKKLAATGFQLLKPGGTMVYSTCSLSREQNEGVVEWLLDEHPDAKFVPMSVSYKYLHDARARHARYGGDRTTASNSRQEKCSASEWLPGSIRFVPMSQQRDGVDATHRNHLLGDGFFLAKIAKQQASSTFKTNKV